MVENSSLLNCRCRNTFVGSNPTRPDYSVIIFMSDKNEALAICSEFAEEYGIDLNDDETIVVYMENKYVNQLKDMLIHKKYRMYSFQAYGNRAVVQFIPEKAQSIFDL